MILGIEFIAGGIACFLCSLATRCGLHHHAKKRRKRGLPTMGCCGCQDEDEVCELYHLDLYQEDRLNQMETQLARETHGRLIYQNYIRHPRLEVVRVAAPGIYFPSWRAPQCYGASQHIQYYANPYTLVYL